MLSAVTTAAYHSLHGEEVDSGASSRMEELSHLNRELDLGLTDEDLSRFENLRVELLDAGYYHKPGYETGRPQKDIKFIRDIAHIVVFRLCGYAGPYYVSEFFKVDLDSLKGKVKKREIVIPRQVAMYFCKRYTQLTLALIGENFGGRDHSTVIHALESVEDMMKTDSNFKSSVEELGKKLKMRMN